MEQNKYEVETGRKLEPKRETYITTSYGEKYKIKDMRIMLTLTTDEMYNSVFKFNVTREIKPSTVNEVVDVNGAKFEVYRGERCFITTQSYTRGDLEEIANIWGNNHEEYIEKPKISRSDRTFLDYVPDDYKYMARDEDGRLFIYKERPRRGSEMWIYDSEWFGIHKVKVRFPMVKWEDEEPWLIEDLKKLEVTQ
nr:MAG TPA: hypothetical protein [Caudoviricetes sp.]